MSEDVDVAELDQQVTAGRSDGEVIARYHKVLTDAGLSEKLIYRLCLAYADFLYGPEEDD